VKPRQRRLRPLLRLASGLCLSLLFLAGCATLPPLQPETLATADTGRALLADWVRRSSQTTTLQGLAKIRLKTPERTLNGTQVILAGDPDRLRAETLSPFGTPLLVLAANGRDLAVLLPGDNLFYQGQATPQNLGRFTRLPLRLADLVGILLSRPPLIDYQHLETFQLSDGGWRIELEAGRRRQLLHFDRDSHLLEVDYLTAGELQLRLAYGEFPPAGDSLPLRINLLLPLQETEVSLLFTELQTDGELLPSAFSLTPPGGATVILLDETAALATGDHVAGQVPAQLANVSREGR